MPSHKHKKKKKSHKKSKRHSSSSSENTLSPWRVPFSEADESDESSNQERLTPLVRRTYMNYLKQALTSNFEDCIKTSSESDLGSIEEIVYKWSSVMEQKALRNCMVSELYRTSMVSLIRQIKASTSDKKLYIEDKNLSKLKQKIPSNKESQTEPQEKKETETQTDSPLPSLLELSLPKSSPSNIPYDPAIEFSDSNSSDGGVSSSLGSKQPQAIPVVCGGQDICNISSTSDLLDVPVAKIATEEDRVDTVMENNLFQKNVTSAKSDCNFFNMICSTRESECTNTLFTQNMNSSNEENNINSKKLITLKKRLTSSDDSVPQHPKHNLDERLSALGLLVENGEDSSSQPVEKSKRSNWFAEETAQSCNLTRVLMRMTTRQREKVLKKIKDLFGDEVEALTELSEANISVCRRRIASVVVSELTPIYQAKKIASRHLFKFLAKKITRSMMERSLAPDTKSIRWRVKRYFEDGKVIMSESDCM